MGKLIKNDNGTYTMKGGFSTKNKEDVAQISELMRKKFEARGARFGEDIRKKSPEVVAQAPDAPAERVFSAQEEPAKEVKTAKKRKKSTKK